VTASDYPVLLHHSFSDVTKLGIKKFFYYLFRLKATSDFLVLASPKVTKKEGAPMTRPVVPLVNDQ